jgi:hypothetical protein
MLEELVAGEVQNEHYHLNNDDYSKEITVALYENDNLSGFSDRYKLLIEENK